MQNELGGVEKLYLPLPLQRRGGMWELFFRDIGELELEFEKFLLNFGITTEGVL